MTHIEQDAARAVAIEHVVWAATVAGQQPAEVLAALGVRWAGRNPPDWFAVELAIAARWRLLREAARPGAEDGEAAQLRLAFERGRAA